MRQRSVRKIALVSLGAWLMGCHDTNISCEDDLSCGNGGAAGFSGEGGAAGTGSPLTGGGRGGESPESLGGSGDVGGGTSGSASSSGGATSGSGGVGQGGSADSQAGAAGSVLTPCAEGCSGAAPYCDEARNACVECLVDAACGIDAPLCDEERSVCVECLSSADCMGAELRCDETNGRCVCASTDDCDGSLVCDPARWECVQCMEHAQCDGETPVCAEAEAICVGCLTNEDCASATASLCASRACTPCTQPADCAHVTDAQGRTLTLCDAGECRECLTNADCTSPGAPRCDETYHCAPCQLNDDCEDIHLESGDALGVCDLSAGEEEGRCVECTGTDYESCGTSGGVPLVCDSLERQCSTALEGSAVLCQECVSDAQCAAGELCVEQMFEGQSVGYFCFSKEGADGVFSDCESLGRPYVSAIAGARSVDGAEATICGLRASTCPAVQDYNTKDCGFTEASGGAGGASGLWGMAGAGGSSGSAGGADDAPPLQPNDALCGFAAPSDARCVPWGDQQFLCTTACRSDGDCIPGATCDRAVPPYHCTL